MGFLLINSAGALRNVARNMLRPGYLPEMCRKVATRLRERNAVQEREQAQLCASDSPFRVDMVPEATNCKVFAFKGNCIELVLAL